MNITYITTITRINPIIGTNTDKIDITTDVPVSTVDTTGLAKPAVDTVEVNRVAPAVLFMAAAVPPPAIIAKAQVITGLKSLLLTP